MALSFCSKETTYLDIFLKNGPILASFFVYFRPLPITILTIQPEKKRGWCAWDSNPCPQDCRLRRYHRAMAASQPRHLITNEETLFRK